MKELSKRILTAALGIPVAVFIILHGGLLFALAIIIISSLTLFEFYNLAENKGMMPIKIPMLLISALFQMFFYLGVSEKVLSLESTFSLLIPTLVATFIVGYSLWEKKIEAFRDISVSLLGFFYITLSFTTLMAVREFGYFRIEPYIDWGPFILIMFASVWICDSAAFFIGKAIGKNKLFPRHSPKKSWEGAIAGFVFGTAAFVAGNHYFNEQLDFDTTLPIGMAIAIFCQLGDLAESHFKRDANVKDSSNFFPGHGGFFDRFDGIIFISPIVFSLMLILI